jgi:hypothetical protein
MLAVSGWVYTSADSGVTWTSNSLPQANWVSGASSANGSNLVVVAEGFGGGISGPVYTSTNAGAAWTPSASAPDTGWSWVASSADGTKLVAAVDHIVTATPPYPAGLIYTSADSGATWNPTTSPRAFWTSVASSSDGTRLIAAATKDPFLGPLPLYTSTDSGATWVTNNTPPQHWYAVASSADGTRLAAAIADGMMYVSTNAGAAWSSSATPFQQWHSAAWSGNGNLLLGASFYGGIYSLPFAVVAPPPVLNIGASGNQAVLTWLTNNSAGFNLQQTTDLTRTNWFALTNIPVVTNLLYQVIVSATNRQDFYRLKSP